MNLIEPFFSLFLEIAQVLFVQQSVEFGKGDFAIAHNRNRNRNIFSYGCGIDIDVHNLGIGCKYVCLAGNPVVKTDADTDQKIAFSGGHIGSIGPMHADHSKPQRIRTRKSTQTHQRTRHGNLGFSGKFRKLFGGF